MNLPDESDPIAQHARRVFDAAVDDLDPAAANRLRLARRAALAEPMSRHGMLVPIGGAVAVAVAIAGVFVARRAPEPEPVPMVATPASADATPSVPAPVVAVPQVAVAPEQIEPVPDPIPIEEPMEDEPAWEELDDDEAELYAWLADAPVAPDPAGDAL